MKKPGMRVCMYILSAWEDDDIDHGAYCTASLAALETSQKTTWKVSEGWSLRLSPTLFAQVYTHRHTQRQGEITNTNQKASRSMGHQEAPSVICDCNPGEGFLSLLIPYTYLLACFISSLLFDSPSTALSSQEKEVVWRQQSLSFPPLSFLTSIQQMPWPCRNLQGVFPDHCLLSVQGLPASVCLASVSSSRCFWGNPSWNTWRDE